MKETKKISAIEKLRNIYVWSDWHNETFNMRIKSIKDWEILYDFCMKNDIEFADDMNQTNPELYIEIIKKLGYKF